MHDRSQANVRNGYGVADNPGTSADAALQNIQLRLHFLGILGPARRAFGGGLLGFAEDAEIGVVERGELPIEPAIHLAPRAGVGGIEAVAVLLAADVAWE